MKEDNIQNIRHTLAHLLASAVGSIYKFDKVKLTLGPAIDNGFYYDIDFVDQKVTDKDLKKIEDTMKKNLPKWTAWEHKELSKDEAISFFKNEYKVELINEIAERGEKITAYTCGGFTDLCRGGHTEHPAKDIDPESFMLDRVAGAYWRGDEKNKMLTRIYGLAFASKAELDAYLLQRDEAIKRDHRKIGKELNLFTIIDEIGLGLPLFYPKGAMLRRLVENFISEEQMKRGYQDIWIPHITKGELYKISGHLDKYDAMYSPMKVDENDYYLKPMNCPHFMMLYKSTPHSYRELPLRYTCTTTNYRYEKSGELSGLTRVRALTQDDCHIFCTKDQIRNEIEVILDMIKDVYAAFGLNDFYVRISLRDSKNKSKYLGEDAVWDTAENALREIVKKTGWRYEEAEDEAAFYGPKLDFMFKDAIGRQWQLSTIQLDFNLPQRFELEYTSNQSKQERPVVIHRAILGSTERFLGVMIEHYAGNFPLWLAPVQVKIIPVRTNHNDYAKEIYTMLNDAGIRAELDDADSNLGGKVRDAKNNKLPYWIVIGDKEVAENKVTLESRDAGNLGQMSKDEMLNKLLEEITNKK